MRLLLRSAALCAALALGVPDARAAVAADSFALPPIAYTDRTLPNGLRLLIAEDHRTPTTAVFIAYHVGGKNDPPGHSGFAHLFEHLMFKGTRNLKPESVDRLTEDFGGFNNAYTAYDVTNYFEVVPSNLTQTVLWMEAERLQHLNVSQDDFVTERKVVIGEYNRDEFGDPYGNLELLTDRAYLKHPYRFGVIGNPAELNSSTLDVVRRFHTTFYRPDNAVLVIAGDVDPVQANAWVDLYFGTIARPAQAIPRVTIVEPKQTAERHLSYSKADVPLPAVRFVYHTVDARSKDAHSLDVLASILGDGKSSRLYESLIYEAQAASGVTVYDDARQQPGIFVVGATAANPAAGRKLGPLIDAQIARIIARGPTAAEVAKAKTVLLAHLVLQRETSDEIGGALAYATIVTGDPATVNRDPKFLAAVTPADVQRVARTYLIPGNRTVIEYTPKAAAAK
jgi:zinc protease